MKDIFSMWRGSIEHSVLSVSASCKKVSRVCRIS